MNVKHLERSWMICIVDKLHNMRRVDLRLFKEEHLLEEGLLVTCFAYAFTWKNIRSVNCSFTNINVQRMLS